MKKLKKHGVAAFPGMVCVGHTPGDEKPIYEHPHGMTLRDYFAAKAMQGILINLSDYNEEMLAAQAYKLADAMLAKRSL